MVEKFEEYPVRILTEKHIIDPTNESRSDQKFQAFLQKNIDMKNIQRVEEESFKKSLSA